MELEKAESVERHIVLVAPEIHWNTGNIGRTCLGAGAHLHLIHPLGFSLESKHVKRAGLDYWERVSLRTWNSFSEFEENMSMAPHEAVLFSKLGSRSFWNMPCDRRRLFLIFGSETKGLPSPIMDRFSENLYHIPVKNEIRSLNLSTAAGIALYESLRGSGPAHGWNIDATTGA